MKLNWVEVKILLMTQNCNPKIRRNNPDFY